MGDVVSAPVLALAAIGVGALGWAVLQQHPRLAVATWLFVIGFVPVWMGVDVGLYVPPATVVAVLVLAALLPRVHGGRVGVGDALMWTAFACATLAFVLGSASTPAFFALVSESVVAFLLGRVAVGLVGERWLYLAVGIVFGCVALLAVVEFVTSWNPFVQLSRGNSLYEEWGSIQVRGGQNRAEGAFGHSIALGCSLALAVPLALASRLRTSLKLPLVALMLLGAAISFSRVGLLTAAVAVALSVLVVREGMTTRVRMLVVGAGVAATAAVAPFVFRVLDSAGDEATGSAAYRGDLLSLVPTLAAFGESSALVRFADGSRRFGSFRSIDNELLLFGLQFGWVPLVAVVTALVAAVVAVVLRRATPATVAVVALLPALSTVALITQYRMWFFFVVGVAVATQVAAAARRSDARSLTDSPPAPEGPRPPTGGDRHLGAASSITRGALGRASARHVEEHRPS